jgi:hypothetical protein
MRPRAIQIRVNGRARVHPRNVKPTVLCFVVTPALVTVLLKVTFSNRSRCFLSAEVVAWLNLTVNVRRAPALSVSRIVAITSERCLAPIGAVSRSSAVHLSVQRRVTRRPLFTALGRLARATDWTYLSARAGLEVGLDGTGAELMMTCGPVTGPEITESAGCDWPLALLART